MSDKIFFIGNDSSDYAEYKSGGDVDKLPLKNLPMAYFPFFYANNEASVDKLRSLVPMLENYSATVDDKSVKYTIDTNKLMSLLSELEQPYQPYNTYNISHIYGVVLVFWLIVGFIFLYIVHSLAGPYYMYVIVGGIFILSLFGVFWTFFITNSII